MSSTSARVKLLSRLDLLPLEAGLHARVIGSLTDAHPSWLSSGTLLDHRWEVATRGQSFRKRHSLTLYFDSVIAPGGRRLTDPLCERDLCTAKVLAFHLLQDLQEAPTVQCELWSLYWFFRWKLEIGVVRTQDLTPAFFDKYVSLVAKSGCRGLVDLAARVEDLKRRCETGEYQPPSRKVGRKDLIRTDLLAHELGVAEYISLPSALRQDLRTWFEDRGQPMRSPSYTRRTRDLEVPAPLGIGSVRGPLTTWQYLWDLRPYLLHDPLAFNPFAVASLGDRIDAIATPSRRTHTIPPLQACTLFDRALRWVTDYSPAILRLIRAAPAVLSAGPPEQIEVRYRALIATASFTGPAAPKIVPDRYWQIRGPREAGFESLHNVAFRLLPAACAIVVAGLAARRNGEVVELQDNCLRRDDLGRPWLEVWIEKTACDFATLPVPESVACAIRLLTELSAPGRSDAENGRLFEFRAPHFGTPCPFKFADAMRHFADYCKIPPVPGEGPWRFRPHQLRRLFAVIYDHRFAYPDLRALSEFLQHDNPQHTNRYITESTRGEYTKLRDEAEVTYRNAKRLYFQSPEGPKREPARHAAAARQHLPGDWDEAVRALQRKVDILHPKAKVRTGTLNASLRSLHVPAWRRK